MKIAYDHNFGSESSDNSALCVRDPDSLETYAPVVDMDLDPGIRRAVLILRRGGVETFESCEGGEGHAEPDPIIRFYGGAYAGYKAFAVAMEHGLPVLHLRRSYSVVHGHLEGPHWEMTFHPQVRETPL